MTGKEDPTNLSGSYALNALDAPDIAHFEKHLENSEESRNEVVELTDTAVLLGLSVEPVTPPPALKANIMSMLDSTPQLAPLAEGEERPVRPLVELVETAPAQTQPDNAFPAVTSKSQQKANSRWFARPAVILAGIAAASALVVGGGLVFDTIGQGSQNQAEADQLAAINAAEDSERVVTPLDNGGSATLVYSMDLASSALIVDGLEPLPADQVYELWYINDEGARPAGTFTADGSSSWNVLEGEMSADDVVGVTIEPHPGSDAPTSDPLFVIEGA
jgi:anti-sigma-K factor RskA